MSPAKTTVSCSTALITPVKTFQNKLITEEADLNNIAEDLQLKTTSIFFLKI